MPVIEAIHPDSVHEDCQLRLSLGLTGATLARERRKGHLRFMRRGRRVFYRGQWLIDWLEHSSEPSKKEAVHA